MPPAKLLTRFPFKMLTGGIIIVQATLDDFKDSLNFILDTGSGGISLDSTTVEDLQLKSMKTDKTIRGIAGMKEVSFTYSHTFRLPGLTIDSMDFHINDYEILTSVYGVRVDGIIGYSFFRRFIISIDYDKQVIDVLRPGSMRYPKGGFYMKPNFSTLPMQTINVRDATQVAAKYYFDTGAGLCMLFSRSFIQDSAFFEKKKKIFHTQGEGLGGKAAMDLTVIKEVKVGPYRFRKVPVYIFEDDYNVTAYPLLGGLIGNDILRRFNVIINYPEQIFYLKPNTRFAEPFDYSYTGLAIYLLKGEVVILDVLPGSPAEKAGFKPMDKIIGIENNLSGDIQAYKTLLQNAGTKLKVIITRDGVLMPIRLPVKDIR
ncbi:MAG: hypothetical protein JWN76_3447 [Chitinophagaceae bacterium]|nr:hypothetical protein [Chitinophagaceae bacterium]